MNCVGVKIHTRHLVSGNYACFMIKPQIKQQHIRNILTGFQRSHAYIYIYVWVLILSKCIRIQVTTWHCCQERETRSQHTYTYTRSVFKFRCHDKLWLCQQKSVYHFQQQESAKPLRRTQQTWGYMYIFFPFYLFSFWERTCVLWVCLCCFYWNSFDAFHIIIIAN